MTSEANVRTIISTMSLAMPIIGVRELARNVSRFLEQVERNGEAVIVTRHGRPVAALMPVDAAGADELLTGEVGRLTRRRPRSVAELPAPIPEVLRDLREGLEALYGARLQGLYVFGSYARGEADPEESDLDVAILLDRVATAGRDIDRTARLASEVSLRYGGLLINKVFVARRDWDGAQTSFLRSSKRDALAA